VLVGNGVMEIIRLCSNMLTRTLLHAAHHLFPSPVAVEHNPLTQYVIYHNAILSKPSTRCNKSISDVTFDVTVIAIDLRTVLF
jgi:hypothetical protein